METEDAPEMALTTPLHGAPHQHTRKLWRAISTTNTAEIAMSTLAKTRRQESLNFSTTDQRVNVRLLVEKPQVMTSPIGVKQQSFWKNARSGLDSDTAFGLQTEHLRIASWDLETPVCPCQLRTHYSITLDIPQMLLFASGSHACRIFSS